MIGWSCSDGVESPTYLVSRAADLYVERPLLLQELVEALRIDPQRNPPVDEEPRLPDQREILDILPNLVNIYENEYESDYEMPTGMRFLGLGARYPIHVTEIKLAHFSVQEFLLSYATKASDRSPLLTSVTLNHSFLTEACLYYIHFYEESEYRTELAKDYEVFPFVRYAFYNWTYHYFGTGYFTSSVFTQKSKRLPPRMF